MQGPKTRRQRRDPPISAVDAITRMLGTRYRSSREKKEKTNAARTSRTCLPSLSSTERTSAAISPHPTESSPRRQRHSISSTGPSSAHWHPATSRKRPDGTSAAQRRHASVVWCDARSVNPTATAVREQADFIAAPEHEQCAMNLSDGCYCLAELRLLEFAIAPWISASWTSGCGRLVCQGPGSEAVYTVSSAFPWAAGCRMNFQESLPPRHTERLGNVQLRHTKWFLIAVYLLLGISQTRVANSLLSPKLDCLVTAFGKRIWLDGMSFRRTFPRTLYVIPDASAVRRG